MQTNEYLKLSERTLASAEGIGSGIFENNFSLLMNSTAFIHAGCEADVVKRSVFYKDKSAIARIQPNIDKINFLIASLEAKKTELQGEDIKIPTDKINLLHAIYGIVSEAGEVMEAVLASIAENREVDPVNLKEETGDLLWYIAILVRHLGISFEDVFASNIAKLSKRFPEKFTTDDALNRDLEAEKIAVEETKA